MKCCVPGCGQKSEKGISFHKFPQKEPERVKEWVDAVSKFLSVQCHEKKCFNPKTSNVICSKHFSSNDYIPVQGGRPVLRNSACPSIFLCDPNTKRQRKLKQCGITEVTNTVCRIAPKPEIKNVEKNSIAKVSETSDANSNSNNLDVSSTGINTIDSQEPDCMCVTPKRETVITEVLSPFHETTSERKADCSTTSIGFDVSVATEFSNKVSENCTSCISLRCENETLRAEMIALRELVASLKEEKGQVQTSSHSIETVTEESVSHGDADNMFRSTPKSCRVLDNTIASDGQDSLSSLQKAVKLDHRYESTPRTLKRKLQSSELQKQVITKRARLTTKKLKRTQLKVAEMKQMIRLWLRR